MLVYLPLFSSCLFGLDSKAILRVFGISHNNPCFPCNIAITNFLDPNTFEIRFHVVTHTTFVLYAPPLPSLCCCSKLNCYSTGMPRA